MEREKQTEDTTLGPWITLTIRQGGTSKGKCEWGRRVGEPGERGSCKPREAMINCHN